MIKVGTSQLTEVILPVQDMNSQVSFYRDVLGLGVKEPQGVKDFREFYTVKLDAGPCSLHLQSGGKQQIEENGPILVFRVEDIHASRYALLEKGALMEEIQSPETGVLTCDGKDPEGNIFSLESRKQTGATPKVTTVIDNTVFSSPYVSANSHRGRSILLLRNNKWMIAAEILCFMLLTLAFPFLGYADFICLYLIVAALMWLRGTSWSELGLAQPVRWKSTLLLGTGFFLIYLVLNYGVFSPLLFHIFGQRADISVFSPIHGNIGFFFGGLLNAWTHAGFAEEMIFRGYLFNRITDLFGRNPLGWTIALLLQAVGFGLGHVYQGINGAVGAALYGVLIGIFYLIIRRNLWACAIAHSLNDTLGFLLIFIA